MPLKTFSQDLTDIVLITHFEGVGSSGYTNRLFQIRRINPNADKYVNTMLLEDASNFTGNAFVLGDGDVLPADWDNAVGGERDYGYLCDGTDGFFDNDVDEGKRLFD